MAIKKKKSSAKKSPSKVVHSKVPFAGEGVAGFARRGSGNNLSAESTGFVRFGDALNNFFRGYFDCYGTATRAEFWWPVLAVVLLVGLPWALPGFILAIMVPFVMVTIRRMHDIGKSGWHYYGIEIGFFALYQVLTAIATSLADKEMRLIGDPEELHEVIVHTGLSGFIDAFALVMMLVVSAYLISLLIRPSLLTGNKYR
ncbi:MAG: DUF805 domain-containing protein [Rickettsiales bacterium]|jgi:uncharacterized membrane protein YhaH (DUF805 family)|nr:DUF805 domain-containing protein [Rickettsiales bacterium]